MKQLRHCVTVRIILLNYICAGWMTLFGLWIGLYHCGVLWDHQMLHNTNTPRHCCGSELRNNVINRIWRRLILRYIIYTLWFVYFV